MRRFFTISVAFLVRRLFLTGLLNNQGAEDRADAGGGGVQGVPHVDLHRLVGVDAAVAEFRVKRERLVVVGQLADVAGAGIALPVHGHAAASFARARQSRRPQAVLQKRAFAVPMKGSPSRGQPGAGQTCSKRRLVFVPGFVPRFCGVVVVSLVMVLLLD
jgi:hypothetical protein